jgi:lipid A ethanolaminephosphotransferase
MAAASAAEPLPKRTSLWDFIALPAVLVGIAVFIVVFDNSVFWSAVLDATAADEHRVGIVASMLVTLLCPLILVLALVPGRRPFKAFAVSLLLVAAVCGFFMNEYHVIIDPSMIRNLVETEIQEASPLLTVSFFWHFALFGLAPAAAVAWLPLGRAGWRRGLALRAGIAMLCAAAFAGTLYVNYGAVSYFGAQHRSVRMLMNPLYPLASYARFALRTNDRAPAVREPLDARVRPSHGERSKPTLVVFVVGETARVDRFSLNGYARDTNRYTRTRGVVSFANVTSCGTSTADSVPCLFSNLGRDGFTHAAAAKRESLFGALGRLGVEVAWRDNSTGCKQVCDPGHFVEYAARDDAKLCDATGCFDELLLENIDELVADNRHDHFIVLHQRGSHGPAYHTDTPAWSKAFLPECDLPDLRNCNLELINNAYDNTILYTDFFLSRVIDFLERHDAAYDVAMLYVSDHGESLGENGLYLHGLPYAIAPREQTQVPMLLWASRDFYASTGVSPDCVRAHAARSLSHDVVFHTLLPLFGVEGSSYRRDLDLLAACRDGGASAPPEGS